MTIPVPFVAGCDASYEMQGPSFVSEPPSRVEFTNVNGGRVDCIVRGNPAPTVDWLAADGGSITSIPGIRHVLGNGTIHFPGFEAEVFRQDVHWAIYKCSAVNSVGAIVSRDVTVRAGTRNFLLVICIMLSAWYTACFLLYLSSYSVALLPSLFNDPRLLFNSRIKIAGLKHDKSHFLFSSFFFFYKETFLKFSSLLINPMLLKLFLYLFSKFSKYLLVIYINILLVLVTIIMSLTSTKLRQLTSCFYFQCIYRVLAIFFCYDGHITSTLRRKGRSFPFHETARYFDRSYISMSSWKYSFSFMPLFSAVVSPLRAHPWDFV